MNAKSPDNMIDVPPERLGEGHDLRASPDVDSKLVPEPIPITHAPSHDHPGDVPSDAEIVMLADGVEVRQQNGLVLTTTRGRDALLDRLHGTGNWQLRLVGSVPATDLVHYEVTFTPHTDTQTWSPHQLLYEAARDEWTFTNPRFELAVDGTVSERVAAS